MPGRATSIMLPRQSQGLYLLQRIRDEAHRFAITSHRKQRTKEGLASRLDSVPGVGPHRRRLLLQHFGSIQDILDASTEELLAVPPGTTRLLGLFAQVDTFAGEPEEALRAAEAENRLLREMLRLARIRMFGPAAERRAILEEGRP